MSRLSFFTLNLSLFLLLAACTSVEPTPTPTVVIAALRVTAVPPTRTIPPPTTTATNTPTEIPTGTAVPATPTVTVDETENVKDIGTKTAAPTDVPTLQPSPTQTVIPTARPLPTQTPIPTASIWTGIGTPMPAPQAVLMPENIAQIQEIGRWGYGRVIDATYSPDGQKLAVATPLGVYFYDANTTELLATISTTSVLLSFALSPDWNYLAIGLGWPDNDIQIWSVPDASMLYAIDHYDYGVYRLTFSPDAQTLYASTSSQPTAWQVSDGRQIESGYPGGTLSPDRQLAAFFDQDNNIHIWRMENGWFVDTQQITPSSTEIQNITTIAISPDGQLVAAGDWNLNVAVWNIQDGSLAYTVDIPATVDEQGRAMGSLGKPNQRSGPGRYTIDDLEFSLDGKILAIATGFEDVTLLQADNGRTLHRLENAGTGITFSPDGSRIAAWAHTLNQWNVQDGTFINGLIKHAGMVTDIAFAPNNQFMAIASFDSFIYLRQMPDGILGQSLESHNGGVYSIDLAQGGQILASGSEDGTMRIWNLEDGTSIDRRASAETEVYEVAISFDGQVVASASYDEPVKFWGTADLSRIGEEIEHFGVTTCPIAFSPIEYLFTTCWDSSYVALWTLEDSRLLTETISPKDLVFSSDGQYLAATSHNSQLRLWRMVDGEMLYSVETGAGAWQNLVFSPDDRLLAITSLHTVQLWDAVSGTLLHTVSGGHQFPSSVAFSPDGRILAIGSTDGTVRLWGVP